MVRLLEKTEALETFAVFHMEGYWDADGTQMIDAIRKAIGNPNLKVSTMPWRLIRVLSPFVRFLGNWRKCEISGTFPSKRAMRGLRDWSAGDKHELGHHLTPR
jgi:hypothetical protein